MGVADIDQLYKILAALHSLALEFAYPRIDQTVVSQLKQTNEKLSHAMNDGTLEDVLKYDQAFHDIILAAASNDFLTSFAATLECHIVRIENLYYGRLPSREDSVHGHEAIIEALEGRNLPAAKEAASRNWLHVIDVLNETT